MITMSPASKESTKNKSQSIVTTILLSALLAACGGTSRDSDSKTSANINNSTDKSTDTTTNNAPQTITVEPSPEPVPLVQEQASNIAEAPEVVQEAPAEEIPLQEARDPFEPLDLEFVPQVERLLSSRVDSLDTLLANGWERFTGDNGMPTLSDRPRVDNASSLFFRDRSYLVSAARIYTITGDRLWLDRAIGIANNFLNLRDDIYADNGGQVFKAGQTGYRSAVRPLLTSNTPAPVWSHDFTDRANNGNPEALGRRVQVLQNGRVLSALAEVIIAYYTHKPSGNYRQQAGAEAGILTGSYEQITQDLITEINRSVRIFDGQWQQDLTEVPLKHDPNDGLWDVKGSYFYDRRQNLSLSGIQTENILPFNHVAGMLQARLVLAKFSDLDPLAVDHFNRWAAHHKSVYASDDSNYSNPGNSAPDTFGYNRTFDAYAWPYTTTELEGEDIDHSIITLEVYMTAYRFSLTDRDTIQKLFRSVESIYNYSATDIYDRLLEFNESFIGEKLLPGTINWLSTGTNLQGQFQALANAITENSNIGIREFEPVVAYYGTERLSRFSAPE